MSSRLTSLLLICAALFAASCTTTAPPPAPVAPSGDARYLIDPRIGYDVPANPKRDQAFDAAWRFYLAGDVANARQRLDAVRLADAKYAPASLVEAAIAIGQGHLDVARQIVDRVRANTNGYTAAEVYDAELALREGNARRAFEIYRSLAQQPGAPAEAKERFAQLQKDEFERLVRSAQTAPESESVVLLREAIAIDPTAIEPRIQLAQKLVAERNYDEARRELETVLNSASVDRPEVQESLAEIDAGRGRYQEAIVRYERLQRRAPSPKYAQRLDEIKEQYAAANMPPQYQRAVETESLTRADFAVLLYWKVASVRFAQNLGAPPIAIDVAEVPGRDELVRAIALGIFAVDPVTRRVGPGSPVNAGTLQRLAARVLSLRGAPCAKGVTDAAKILAACNVTDPLAGVTPDAPVSGRTAAALLEQIDRATAR